MDMRDGTVWRDPQRPAGVTVGINGIEVPGDEETDVCYCCGEHEIVAIFAVEDDTGKMIRAGVCEFCLKEHDR